MQDTTTPDNVAITQLGLQVGDDFADVVQLYEDAGAAIAYEDDEVIIYIDDTGHEITEWAKTTGHGWNELNELFHDVASRKMDDVHLVFSEVYPIPIVKDGGWF